MPNSKDTNIIEIVDDYENTIAKAVEEFRKWPRWKVENTQTAFSRNGVDVNSLLHNWERLQKTEVPNTHFPGCHKAHIECANKAIDEARDSFSHYAKLPILGITIAKESLGFGPDEAKEWLDRWRVEE